MYGKKKIVVTGGSGRFGATLKKLKTNYKFVFPKKSELNINNLSSIRKFLKTINQNLIYTLRVYLDQ